MELKIVLQIILILSIVSSITSIIIAIKDHKVGSKLTAIITFIVAVFVIFIFFNQDKISIVALPEPPITDPISIKGSYTGYFIDKLGSEVPPYLDISFDSVNDSVKFIFKNDYTVIYNGVYDLSNQKVIVDGLNNGKVSQVKGKVIIESTGNIENRWKFTKDRRAY